MKTQIVKALAYISLAGCLPAADVSRIYVLSSVNKSTVSIFSPDGQKIGTTSQTSAWQGNVFTVDSNNKVFIVRNFPTAVVRVFEADGTSTMPVFNVDQFVTAITTDAAGRIYVLVIDRSYNRFVRTFTPDGKPLAAFDTGLRSGGGLAVNDGKIYVAFNSDNLVKVYDANGQDIGPTIRAGLQVPRSVAVGPDGKIYVAGFVAVTTYLPNGQRTEPTITHRNPSTTGLDGANAVAVDSNGKIYVGWDVGQVGIYKPDGTVAAPFINTPQGILEIVVR